MGVGNDEVEVDQRLKQSVRLRPVRGCCGIQAVLRLDAEPLD